MRAILVTGGGGQLAVALANLGGGRVQRVGRPGFDFDRPETLAATLRQVEPRMVVNAAAWTAVDAAEADEAAAARANTDGPARLAGLCAEAGIPLIHVSTDYVFDGDKGAPYLETDPTSPTGAYGRTKAAGEQAVLASCPQAIVLRTSWVYSATGRNFVRTMVEAGATRPVLRVVGDQRGCPTSADDLAAAILAIAERLDETGWRPGYGGIFHAAGTGEATWHGLAIAALEATGRPMPEVIAIRTEDWPTPARRPADSRLDCTRLEQVFGIRLPDWQPSVAGTVQRLLAGVTAPPGSDAR